MGTSVATEIEQRFAQLPPEAQLTLLERLVHHVRTSVGRCEKAWDNELSKMAADPQIRRELESISAEFSATETDGLGRS